MKLIFCAIFLVVNYALALHQSSSPGRSILVLGGFRCIVGKLNTWRNLFVPWSHDKILGILEEMIPYCWRLNWVSEGCLHFVVQNIPFPTYLTHQSSQNQACIRIHHCAFCLRMKSLLFNIDPHPALAFPLTLLRFWVSEMVRGEKFGPCCLPDLASSYYYSKEHSS